VQYYQSNQIPRNQRDTLQYFDDVSHENFYKDKEFHERDDDKYKQGVLNKKETGYFGKYEHGCREILHVRNVERIQNK